VRTPTFWPTAGGRAHRLHVGWDEDYFNEEVQAFIESEANGTGHFQFGYAQGYMDRRAGTRDGQPAVEWTWDGMDGDDG
jgi:hypothetical protein